MSGLVSVSAEAVGDGLRNTAEGVPAQMAAAELLVWNRRWVERIAADLSHGAGVAPYVEFEVDEDGTPWCSVRWAELAAYLEGGGYPEFRGTAAQIMRIVLSLACGHPIDLRDAVGGLDMENIRLVMYAVAVAQSGSVAKREFGFLATL